jgi:dihydropteroate synthase
VQNTPFSTNKTVNINGRLLDLTIPKIMGVLNVTPDSFYDGGKFIAEEAIILQVDKMLSAGADFIDVGGYSSRPGAADISEDEEKSRSVRAIELIARQFPNAIISIDTFRSGVAKAAVDAGASMINDISGGSLDAAMFETVAKLQVPYILMHMRGTPQTMRDQTQYKAIIKDIVTYFQEKIQQLKDLEVKDIIVDPGFGFAKTREQNFNILRNLENFGILGRPIMVGLSRKSMIWKTLDIKPEEALNGTTALHMMALWKGANILRVHDVREAKEVIKLFTSFNDSNS